jgi:hypothetical protein
LTLTLKLALRERRGGERGPGAPYVPPIKIFEKLQHKNAIKHDPPDFLTTQSTLLKRICQKNPRTPPPLDFQLLCMFLIEIFVETETETETNIFPDHIYFTGVLE